MKSWWKAFYKNNKAIVWAAGISSVLVAGILIKVPDEVTRFTLIMPIFAGFIFFSILITSDEELEGKEALKPAEARDSEHKTSQKPKKSSKK